jgi:hypothetical protein
MSISVSNGGNVSNGLVDGHVVLVNHRGFHNMLDWVDFVGFGYRVRLGYLNGIGFGNRDLDNNFSLNRDGHGNRDLDFVFIDLNFGFDSGHLRGNTGVGANGCGNFCYGYCISRCGTLVGRWGRDGSIR